MVKALASEIPDVWFDWYARFLPGLLAIAILAITEWEQFKAIGLDKSYGWLIIPVMLIAYLIGHIMQPLAGFIVKKFEGIFKKNEKAYAAAKLDPAIPASALHKVSKAHAEANGMMSSFLILIIFLILFKLCNYYIIALLFYLLFATGERILARKRKIENLLKTGEDFGGLKIKNGTHAIELFVTALNSENLEKEDKQVLLFVGRVKKMLGLD